MTCDEAESRLSAFLDGEAPEVEPHLASCAGCRGKLESLRKADALLGRAADRFAALVPAKADRILGRVARRRWRPLWAAAALLVAAFLGTWVWVNVRTADSQEVLVFGASRWVAGTTGVLRVVVRDALRGVPVAGAVVRASLAGAKAEATSGADGSAEIRLPAPDAERAAVAISVTSPVGTDTLEREVSIARPVRLLVSTDKPLYQPAQTVHLRVLALDNFTMKPFAGEVTLEVEDPNGNRVFRKALPSSAFGIAACDFALADEVNLGTWRVRAAAGGASSERTVEVKRYVLPKFRIELKPDKGFYAPADRLKADLEARYLFGKPVAGGSVNVELSTWVADRFETFERLSTKTDAEGRASIETRLPDRFFDTDLARGDALLRIEAEVTDGAGHLERRAVASTVSQETIRIQAFPEDGDLVRGVDQRMFVLTSYPDGTPARATVEMDGGPALETDGTGVLLAPLRSSRAKVRARDSRGNRGEASIDLHGFQAWRDFVVRPDRTSYRAGETMEITALGKDGIVYVDLVKSDQTLLTKWVEIRGGRGNLAVDLPADLFGTVRVTGYRIQDHGRITRDSRIVVVDFPGDLRIRPTLPKQSFEPGEEIAVDFELLDVDGKPVAGALSLSVVDEAVFALHEARPGLEKTYFQIEEELLKPRVQLKPAGPLASPVPTPARLAIAAMPEVSTLATALHTTRRWAIEEFAGEFNRATFVGLGILALVICVVLMIRASFEPGHKVFLGGGCAVGVLLLFGLFVLLSSGRVLVQMQLAGDGRSAGESARPTKDGRPGGDLISPRIRQFFPETLYWNPEIVTDERGRASVKFPGADSITTWRMAMSAVTRAGRLGAGEQPIRVFQPFFVDLDLPVALTQGDEVWLPVAVYNYLEEPQSVALAFEAESGFEVVGEREKKLDVRLGDVTSVRFHVRAREFGRHAFTVKAVGTKFSDAVRRSIDVLPDGKEIPVNVTDRVTGNSRATVTIPAEAIDGATRLWVRLFPSTFSEIVTGLEGLVRMPYG